MTAKPSPTHPSSGDMMHNLDIYNKRWLLEYLPDIETRECKTQETYDNGYNLPIYQVCHLHVSVVNVHEREYQSGQRKPSLKEKRKLGLKAGLKDH